MMSFLFSFSSPPLSYDDVEPISPVRYSRGYSPDDDEDDVSHRRCITTAVAAIRIEEEEVAAAAPSRLVYPPLNPT